MFPQSAYAHLRCNMNANAVKPYKCNKPLEITEFRAVCQSQESQYYNL